MRKVLVDLKASFKMFYRDKSTIFWTIAFPCIMILLFGAIFSQTDSGYYDLTIQNLDLKEDGTPNFWSKFFIERLNETGMFNIKMLDREVNATDYAIKEQLSYMLIFPENFTQEVNAALATKGLVNASIIFIYDPSQTAAMTIMGVINGMVNEMNLQFAGGSHYLTISEEKITPERMRYVDFFIPGIIAVTVMTTSIFGAVEVNTKYKANGILRRLAATPLLRIEWIISKSIFRIALCFIATAIILGLGKLVFDVTLTLDAVSILMIIAESLMFSGMGMIISRAVKETEAAGAAANAITFPMMFLSGAYFPLEFMPDFLRVVARALPLTYVNDGLRAAMIFGNFEQALFNTALIVALGVACIIIGAVVTKWEEE